MKRGSSYLGLGLMVAGLASVTAPAYAKTIGYVFAIDGTVLTLDTDTDTIVVRRTVPDLAIAPGGDRFLYLSAADNLLLESYVKSVDRFDGTGEWRLAAYDLKTLAFKMKDLGFVSRDEPTVVLPPKGPYFFVRWFDVSAGGGQGATRVTRFDKASLSPLGDLQAPDLQDCNRFSPDGARIYSTECGSVVEVRILDARDLRLLSNMDSDALLAPGRWSGGISDVQGDSMLLIENLKAQRLDSDRYTFFTLRLTDLGASPRIGTGTEGNGYLTPTGNKIVLLETTTIRGPEGGITDMPSVGRLHVYDVATGAKLGQVTFPVRGAERLQGIRPQGDKLYLASVAARAEDMTITVISLLTFQVVKELVVPVGGLRLFEEVP